MRNREWCENCSGLKSEWGNYEKVSKHCIYQERKKKGGNNWRRKKRSRWDFKNRKVLSVIYSIDKGEEKGVKGIGEGTTDGMKP